MGQCLSRVVFKGLTSPPVALISIWVLTGQAWGGWQRDMVLGNPAPAQPRAPVYTGPTADQIAAQQAAQQAAQEAADREAKRQATLRAAHAANDAGLSFWKRHEWGAAVEQFRQALAKSPGDKVLQNNLAKATEQLQEEQQQQVRKQEDTNMASQMSATLQQLTAGMPDFDGHNTGSVPATGSTATLDFMPVGSGEPRGKAMDGQMTNAAPSTAVSWQDANVVDLRGTTKTSVDPATVKGKTSAPTDSAGLDFISANGSATSVAQNQTPVGDPNVVDLRGTTKTAVDPAAINHAASAQPAGFRKNAAPPPNPNVQLPQNRGHRIVRRTIKAEECVARRTTSGQPTEARESIG